jgi:hypothetical protein
MSVAKRLLSNRQAQNRYDFTFPIEQTQPPVSEVGEFQGFSGNNAVMKLENGETIEAKLYSNSYLKPGQRMAIKISGGQAWVSGMPQGSV